MPARHKQLLLLAPHEPTADPRIIWAATHAPSDFSVSVVGIEEGGERKMEDRIGRVRVYRSPSPLPDKEDRRKYWKMVASFLPVGARILFVSGLLLTRPIRRIWNLLTRLTKVACQPLYCALCMWSVRGLNKYRDSHRIENLSDSFWRHFYMWRNWNWLLKYYYPPCALALLNCVKGLKISPDIIHCNDFTALPVAIEIKRLTGAKIVYDCHEIWPVNNVNVPFYGVWVLRFLEKYMVRHADKVVTVSPQCAKVMLSWYRSIDSADMIVVPNAAPRVVVPTPEQLESISQGKTRINHLFSGNNEFGLRRLAGDRVVFLYQGGISPGRGLENMIDYWSQIDGSKALLVIRGPVWDYSEYLEKKATTQIRCGKILFVPPVTEKDLILAASEADVGLIPYTDDSLNNKCSCPNKLSQYMQAGLAILSTDTEFIKSVIDKEQCGVTFNWATPQSFVDAVNDLIDESNLTRCRTNAFLAAQDEFNWESVSRPLVKTYRGLIR